MERLAVPHTRARSALASRRGPDRVLIACGNQAGLFAVFFALRGRGLPCDPLKTLPRNVRLSPLPKLHAPVRKFESAGIVPSHRGSGRHLGYNTEHFGQSMSAEIKSHLTELLTRALAKVAPQQPGSLISLERPKQAQHGDFSCPAAMQLARALKRNPRELALELVAALPPSEWLERAEVAGGGFINLRVRPAAKQHIVQTILTEGDRYGRADRAGGRPVIVEFVSANPTGPLHVGHGRQAALGDAIGALLESQGWRVTREFYYNDTGAQIRNLGLSVQARIREKLGVPAEFPADGYHGDYVREIAEKYREAGNTDGEDFEAVTRFAVAELRREQDLDLQAFGVRFDSYYLESSLYRDGRVQKTVQALIDAGKTFEQDGALWLKTTEHGDARTRGAAGRVFEMGARGSAGLSRLRAPQDGHGNEGWRGDEDFQARRLLRHASRADRRGRTGRGAVLPPFAQGRRGLRVRHRPCQVAIRRESRILRAVRARPDPLGGGTMENAVRWRGPCFSSRKRAERRQS